jgi:integrase/recombinase XerD
MNQNLSGPSFPTLVQDFFCQYLIAQRNVSKQTVASYRDTFRLFLTSIQQRTGKAPSTLLLTDVNTTLVLAFLDHLEQNRGNSVRTRNNRLAAIRAFMRYASHRDPTCLPSVQQVLAIPMKRFDRPMLDFLSRQEIQAILDAPDTSTWSGHRDFVLFTTLYNTGARVSEIINYGLAM